MLGKRLIFIAGVVLLLLSGCGVKSKVFVSKSPMDQTGEAIIAIHNGAGKVISGWASRETRAFTNAIEVAATTTLENGYRYFAIVKPDEISNLKGSLINTAKEVIEKCSPSKLLQINIYNTGLGLHKCGTYNTRAKLVIAMYKTQPEDFTVFDAKEVIKYLEDNELFENRKIDVSIK